MDALDKVVKEGTRILLLKRESDKHPDQQKKKKDILSLDRYLSKCRIDCISRGPYEKSGPNDYHYQQYENIYNYFMAMLAKKKSGVYTTLCVPDFYLRINDINTRAAVGYIVYSDKLFLPMGMKKAITECKYPKIRFIYFTFMIIEKNIESLSHANICIIDLKKELLERFEPMGQFSRSKETADKIDSHFKDYLLKELGLDNFTYISPQDTSPLHGVQTKVDAYNGMCITISMMYIHLRLLNPDIEPNKLIKSLTKKPKKELKEQILRYAKKVQKVLTDNEDLVAKLNHQLFYQHK